MLFVFLAGSFLAGFALVRFDRGVLLVLLGLLCLLGLACFERGWAREAQLGEKEEHDEAEPNLKIN